MNEGKKMEREEMRPPRQWSKPELTKLGSVEDIDASSGLLFDGQTSTINS